MRESTRSKSKPPRRRKSKHLDHEIIAELAPNQFGYRDAAEILSTKLHALFTNTLKVTAPNVIYDIDTLIVNMMDVAPTHLADLMTNEFSQGYMAGFVMSKIDHVLAELELEAAMEAADNE